MCNTSNIHSPHDMLNKSTPHPPQPQARAHLGACTTSPDPPLAQGDRVHLVGLTRALKVLRREATITTGTSSVCIMPAEVPRFRAVHEEVVKLDHDFGVAVAGVLTDDRGVVRAMWGSYSEQIDREDREWAAGMHAYAFVPWIERVASWLGGASMNKNMVCCFCCCCTCCTCCFACCCCSSIRVGYIYSVHDVPTTHIQHTLPTIPPICTCTIHTLSTTPTHPPTPNTAIPECGGP